ncbi:hypothetical protein M1C57_11710 [Rhodococcus pyridinivorans]|nr:PaaX family transcriptional regulator C-terminal domain-containing protein [Rhodococcus pyridinivorans]UPW02418.1 hypothetical protein M1C57_11710 [Rhodococcus pyridinivorans]
MREFSSEHELLIAYLQLADSLHHMPYLDPRLPEVLVPGWSGLRAAKQLHDLRTEWTTAAHARWRDIAGID